MRTLSSDAHEYLGFFNPVWSPDGRRLAFLSADSNATVRLWIWNSGGAPAVRPEFDIRVGFGDPPFLWITDDRLAIVAWDDDAEKSGDLYFHILRGANAAREWKQVVQSQAATVSVLESGKSAAATAPPSARLISLDLRTRESQTLARGAIHRLQFSADGHSLAYRTEAPGQPLAKFFERASDAEAGYEAVNGGTESHTIELPSARDFAKPSRKPDPGPLPPPNARLLSRAPAGDGALYVANASDGSHLLLGNQEIWRGNEWMSEIQLGRAERIEYTAADGTALNAWLLLPPNYVAGTKVPMVTIIYPDTVYGADPPGVFSPFRTDFEHAQLFAAMGYAVLRPSMPPPKNPADAHSLELLPVGVLPAVDAAIARGIADPRRIAVLGQSDGGFAAIGILTQTTRFRSAIASAGFSDLVSLYGTFYGQYRHGDAGSPLKGQALRMLQLEQGSYAFGGPPWSQPDRYRSASAIQHAGEIQTPLMLIHGDLDFVPIQQAEEMFTALYRQGKRASLVRYSGEWHTIAARADVLDLWQRMSAWLKETMGPEN